MLPVVMVVTMMLVQLRQQALEEERLKREQEEEEAKAQVCFGFYDDCRSFAFVFTNRQFNNCLKISIFLCSIVSK